MDNSELYMARCIALAAQGQGRVAPNPLVGAVVVCNGRIIGEGFHRCYGEAHAEVNALSSVHDESLLLQSTLYVNLEPCSHIGKTPPCTELILQKKIPRVVVACLDPYPEVAGRGIKRLREEGVEVITGVLEQEARALNRYFMTAQEKCRPYIILKWAQSADGYIDRIRNAGSGKPTVLSTSLTRQRVHKLRSEVQAIMVGTNTVIWDDPSLTVRHWSGNSPVRVLIDRHLRVPTQAHLLDGTQPTLVFTDNTSKRSALTTKENVEYIEIESNVNFLEKIMTSLFERKLYSLLVEGGAHLHQSLMEMGLWDEILVETAPVYLRKGVKSAGLADCDGLQLQERQFVPNTLSPQEKYTVIERYVHC